MQIGLLTPAQVLHYWPQIQRQLDAHPTMRGGPTSLYAAQAMFGMVQVWGLVDNSDMVETTLFSEVLLEEGKTVLNFFGAYGENLDRYMDHLPEAVTQLVDELSIDEVRIQGRIGWARKLRSLGFEIDYVVLKKRMGTLH